MFCADLPSQVYLRAFWGAARRVGSSRAWYVGRLCRPVLSSLHNYPYFTVGRPCRPGTSSPRRALPG
eukprot:1700127-Pyramimonas_sp.AAC.1